MPVPAPATRKDEVEVALRRASLRLDTQHPLYDETEALALHGLSGSVIAIVSMPNCRDIGIIDHGPDFKDKPILAEYQGLGKPLCRYALMGLNYNTNPDNSNLLPYAPLGQGDNTIGRVAAPGQELRHIPYYLDLARERPIDLVVSSNHTTIRMPVVDNTVIDVIDHSKYGTFVVHRQP